jgi:hypothetical protein
LVLTACLAERDRPGPPRVTFSIDDISAISATHTDTLRGSVSVADPDGIDSVWVALDSVEKGEDAGLDRNFGSRWLFIVNAGASQGAVLPLTFRARDIAGFEAQRDTYVVVGP